MKSINGTAQMGKPISKKPNIFNDNMIMMGNVILYARTTSMYHIHGECIVQRPCPESSLHSSFRRCWLERTRGKERWNMDGSDLPIRVGQWLGARKLA